MGGVEALRLEQYLRMSEIMTDTSATTRAYWIHALTPLHVGSGRGVGFIDLPILREAVTNWPVVPGSAVKGVLLDHHSADGSEDAKRLRRIAFGQGGDDTANAGSLVLTDARIVCLPVRSYHGTFAWCTSPFALERLRRDLRLNVDPGVLRLSAVEQSDLLVPESPSSAIAADGRAYFEDLDFDAKPDQATARWAESLARYLFSDDAAWGELFKERFAVVHDDVFNFLCETATQVDARVRIDDATKTVADGQLWYEESLPAETVLAGVAWCGPLFGSGRANDSKVRETLIKTFCTDAVQLQIGGKATIGRGQVRLVFST